MAKKALLLPLVGVCVIGLATFVTLAQEAHEEDVTLDQVPAAVRATILKESAGGQITEIERETRNGKTAFEAEFLLKGQEIEIRIAPDGTLLGRELEDEDDDDDGLTLDQVPPAVRAAFLKLAGDAKIAEIEREKEHGTLVYEAQWVVEGVHHEAAVTADGALLETEETVRAQDVPAAVRAAITKHFGVSTKVVVEKKMIVVYEAEARIGGREKELLIFPTGRVHETDEEHGDADGEHENDDDDDEDDDD